MPPKQAKKAGDLDDFSDANTLPNANIFKFTIIPKIFYSQENRDKIKKRIDENLVPSSGDKIKLLTREEITNYGKLKQYILDPAIQQSLPPEDPRKNISEVDQMAKSAADKIFEMSCLVRRAKRDRIAKLEEEAQAKATEENPAQPVTSEDGQLDGMIYLVDYPQTLEEALALSRHSQSLNGVFVVSEVPKSTDEEDDEEEAGQEEEDMEGSDEEGENSEKGEGAEGGNQEEKKEAARTPDSEEQQAALKKIQDDLLQARNISAPNSSLRHLAFIDVPFQDEKKTSQVTDADGNVIKKEREPEDAFIQDLFNKYLDKYGQYFVQYSKFRELVTVDPLMPDKTAIEEIRKLEIEGDEIAAAMEESQLQMNEEIGELAAEIENKEGEDKEETEKAMENVRSQAALRKEEIKKQDDRRRSMIMNLSKRKKVSLDDERDYSKFKTDVFQKDFVDNSETKNKLASILSAMVTQIDQDNNWDAKVTVGSGLGVSQLSEEAPTAAESLDDLFEHFANEISCDLKLKERGPDEVKGKSLAETLDVKHNRGIELHEEHDRTLEVEQSLPLGLVESQKERVKLISQRENQILQNLNLPGKDRNLMPSIPAKSKRSRDSEMPGFYPFCTLPIDDAERMLKLKQMQQLVKQNFIDSGTTSANRHAKNKIFAREFENHYSPQIFKQVFSDAMLDEPDMASLYYPRTDALLIGLYNKQTPQAAKNDKASTSKGPSVGVDLDGQRNWRAAYRVMPDFQNWVEYFAEEIVFEQEVAVPVKEDEPAEKDAKQDKRAKEKGQQEENPEHTALTVNIMKYQMDEDLLPERMLDIEDDKVQNISEKSGLMYPDDNSVMRVDHFTVGGQKFSKSLVIKDNLRFGLRKRDQTRDEVKQEIQIIRADENAPADLDDPKEGLVSYAQDGDTEFWLNFENGTKLGVEQVIMKRNPYKMMRIDPAPPTAEEIAAKEALIKQKQEATAKAAKQNKPPPTDIIIPETPKPTFQQKELNHLDQLFTDEMVGQNQSMATLTLTNGLIVQYMGNGSVVQIHESNVRLDANNDDTELNRLLTKEGVVIRQLRNRNAEVLYPDGQKATFNRAKMEWIITNNKGKRRQYKDAILSDLESIPCATETDAVSGAKMMIREDNVCTVEYKDGGLFTQHSDGTQMHTSPDGKTIRIEKQGYAAHAIQTGHGADQKKKLYKTVHQRALNDTVLETYLPDGSISQTFLDSYTKKNGQANETFRHMFKRADLSVVVVDGQGHVSVISSNARASLNEAGQKQKLDYHEKDNDYLKELERCSGQYLSCVYQAHISAKAGKSTIKTKNSQDNTIFVLKSDHTLSKRITEVPQPEATNKTNQKKSREEKKRKQKEEPTQLIGDMELEQVGQYQDPHTKYFLYPRFFVVNNNGTASELISSEQLEYAMRKKRVQVDQTLKQQVTDVINNQNMGNHYFLTKVINMKQREIEQTKLRDLQFPQNAVDVLGKHIEQPEITLQIPRQEQYLYSQIFQLPPCDEYVQQAFSKDYFRYKEWKMQQVRFDTEFAIIHAPVSKDQPVDWVQINDDEFNNKRINQKILKYRAQPLSTVKAEEFKQSAVKSMFKSSEVQEFRDSMNNSVKSTKDGKRWSQPASPRGEQNQKQNKPGSGQGDRNKPASSHGRAASTGSEMSVDLDEEEKAKNQKREEIKAKLAEKEKVAAQKEKERQATMAAKLTQERTEGRQKKIESILNAREQKKETPSFVPEYFKSSGGTNFLTINPPQPPSEEVLMRMKQRMDRTHQAENEAQSFKGSQGYGNASAEGGELQERSNDLVMVGEGIDDKDNPIVALEPDEHLKQGSAFMGSKKAGTSVGLGEGSQQEATVSQNQTVPSLYMQEKIYLYSKDQEALLKAEEHHIVKTKDFNVYGRLRDDPPKVKSLAKSNAQSELNEKFITTECITDRRVKMSSMAPRYYMNAPSVNDVRKQGQHQMILSAINKKQTFAELINQANSMVTGVLHDNLKRSLNIMPSSVQFGALRAGTNNEVIITLKNEDSVAHRITIKPTMDRRILVKQEEYGIIAPGMMKKVIVSIRVPEDEKNLPSNVKDTITIVSKHDIFKIPVSATIMSYEQFEEENKQNMETAGKSIQNSRVRERLHRALLESRQSEKSEGPELLTKKPKEQEQKDGEDPLLAEVRRQQKAKEDALNAGSANDANSKSSHRN